MSGSDKSKAGWTKRVLGVDIEDIKRRDARAKRNVDEFDVQAGVMDLLGHGDTADRLRIAKTDAQQRYSKLHEKTEAIENNLQLPDRKETMLGHYEDLGSLEQSVKVAVSDTFDALAIGKLRLALAALFDKCKDAIGYCQAGPAKEKLNARLEDASKALNVLSGESPRGAFEKIESAARRLLDDALKESHSTNRDPIPVGRNKAYAQMIRDRYGVKVTVATVGDTYWPIADLTKVYDALSLVPAEHVITTSLKEIKIEKVAGNRADFSKDNKSIRLDTAQLRQRPNYTYDIGGKTQRVPTLKVATLHEVGHAVDDRAGVMNDATGDDLGGWQVDVAVGTVAEAYMSTITLKTADQQHRLKLLTAVEEALESGTWREPEGVPPSVMNAAKSVLNECAKLSADSTPWKTPRPAGEVAYHRTYQKWYGYKTSARKAVHVSDYQWRSPVEWFAELYAASWITKAKPPSGVNANAARFMFRG